MKEKNWQIWNISSQSLINTTLGEPLMLINKTHKMKNKLKDTYCKYW